MTSADDISQMFDNELQKLQNLIDAVDSKPDLDIHGIVETYYQVMNVSSMSVMLRGQAEPGSKSLLDRVYESEKLISKRFSSDVQLKIMKALSDSILADTKKLQSKSPGKKSKEEIKLDAKLFEDLRQKMSTKEFVEQYDKSLHHD